MTQIINMKSITQTLDTSLPVIAIACLILLLGSLSYRVIRILVSILMDAMLFAAAGNIMKKEQDGIQRLAQIGLLGNAAQFAAIFVLAILRLCIATLRAVAFVMYALLPFILLAAVLAVVQLNWSHNLIVLMDVLNGPFASTLRTLVLTPLTILSTLGTNLLPIYNLLVFVIVQIPLQLLLWILQGDGATHMILALRQLSAAMPAFVEQGHTFVNANAPGVCPSTVCLSAPSSISNITNSNVNNNNNNGYTSNNNDGEPSPFICLTLASSTVAQACLNPANRELNLVPAFAHLQQASAHIILSIGSSCSALALVLNTTLFPLTDPTLWYAIDRTINAFLSAVVVAPASAAQRCTLAGGFSVRPAMCTPDFGPAFDLAASAAAQLGSALTHWIDSLYVFIFDQESLMQGALCNAGADYSTLWTDAAMQALFGSNATVLVRMVEGSSFALTDGLSVVYIAENPLTKTYAPQSWPFPVNVHYGIARVWLPTGVDTADGGVGLLGCACSDEEEAIQVRCAVVNKAGNAYVLPVIFSLAAETQLLTCNRIRINVESIRWLQTRPAVIALAGQAPASSSEYSCSNTATTCLAADVAIWLTPVCGAGGEKALACVPEASFTMGICYPYCLALRLQHEGLGRPTMQTAEDSAV